MFFLFRYVTYLVHIVDGENIYLRVARYFFLRSRKYEKANQSLKESLKSVYSSFSLEPIPT